MRAHCVVIAAFALLISSAASAQKKPGKVGKLTIGTGSIVGFCAKKQVAERLHKHADAYLACFQQRLKDRPKLSGQVRLRFTIGLEGLVSDAKTQTTTLKDKTAEDCMVGVLKGTPFVAPEGGLCMAQWPFVFTLRTRASTKRKRAGRTRLPTLTSTP